MATDYSAFLDALSAALDTRDLLLANRDGSLPALTVGTLPTAIGKGVANGVAALNGAGVPVTAQGVAMATVGTGAGQAAEAVSTAVAVSAANAAASAAQASAAKGMVVHKAVGSSYPGRPVTAAGQAVMWATPTVAPPAVFGTVTSQTGPVDGLDVVLLSAGLQVAT